MSVCDIDFGLELRKAHEEGYAEGLRDAAKWISVKERLPTISGKYIVCTEKDSVYCTRFKVYGENGHFQTDINTHVTHWMPLPKPPGEEKNGRNHQAI